MIENEAVRSAVTDILTTLIEAGGELCIFIENEKDSEVQVIIQDMINCLSKVKNAVSPYSDKQSPIRLPDLCTCAIDSLYRIATCYPSQKEKALIKAKFELSGLLRDGYLQFRYWGCSYPDENKIVQFRRNELRNDLIWNPWILQSVRTGKYKYDLSIHVLAYNKLEYTRQCIESLRKYLPVDIKYELILVNHGSNDGTKEYFEQVGADKQIDISVNGAAPSVILYPIEGEYCITVSNDTIITPNALNNLYDCLKEDNRIGWAVPSTPNISNLQTINAQYNNMEELEQFSLKNNIRDIKREEQRVRLCNPITAFKTSIYIKMLRDIYCELYGVANTQSFPDDKLSLWYRRHGYKSILSKDAYCHHFGSVTLKDTNTEHFFSEGRTAFKKAFGIDPWGTGFCYSPELFSKLECCETAPAAIAGINCGMGSNPLKVKEILKEKVANFQSTIINYTDDLSFRLDLQGASDFVEVFENENELLKKLKDKKFNYIILEDGIKKKPVSFPLAYKLMEHLEYKGQLCIKCFDPAKINKLTNKHWKITYADSWLIIKSI